MKTEYGIDSGDLDRLTMLSCELVNQMDFPARVSSETPALLRNRLTSLLEELSQQYQDSELLFDLRAAILSVPVGKTDIYRITRDLVRMLRNTAGEHATVPASVALPFLHQVSSRSVQLQLAS